MSLRTSVAPASRWLPEQMSGLRLSRAWCLLGVAGGQKLIAEAGAAAGSGFNHEGKFALYPRLQPLGKRRFPDPSDSVVDEHVMVGVRVSAGVIKSAAVGGQGVLQDL